MRGQDPIIAMRKRGTRPAIVFINDYPDRTANDWQNPGGRRGETWPSDHATVCTHGDVIQLLDMRFVKGLRVSITGTSEVRTKALFAHCKAAGASTVAASHAIEDGHFVRSGWTEVFHRETEVAHG